MLYQQDSHALVAARAANAKRLERAGYTPREAAKLLPLLAGSTATVNAVLVQVAARRRCARRYAAHIERWLHFSAFTTAEERDLMLEGRLKKMSAVLGLFRSLLVVVSIVIIALIVYVLTIEKIRPIATLKLIGAPNRVIVRMILEQSLALTLGSFAVAYALMSLVRDRFPRTLVLLPEEIPITFAVMLAGGVRRRASWRSGTPCARRPRSRWAAERGGARGARSSPRPSASGELAVHALRDATLVGRSGRARRAARARAARARARCSCASA